MNGLHQSYRERLNQKEDFKVKYKFRLEEEGGRKHLPYQGIRSDFWYECDKHETGGIFMIWPEFEDENGGLISSGQVPREGTARMWIINYQTRKYHQTRIKKGTKGYFMEGARKTADCEVIEIVDLLINRVEVDK
jgi:hypothetical protein